MPRPFPSWDHPATMPKMHPTPKSPSSKKVAWRLQRIKERQYAEAIRLVRQRKAKERVLAAS